MFRKRKTEELTFRGEKTEGIIFELESSGAGYNNSRIKDKVTVRFVTKSKEWITAEIKQESAIFYTGQYKPGEKVDVYYDPLDPENFYVGTKQSETKNRLLMFVIGMVFLSVGVYGLS